MNFHKKRTMIHGKGRLACIRGALIAAGLAVIAPAAMGTGLDLGVAGNYSVISLGNGKTIGQNSGPVAGNELLGNGVTANFSGGGGGSIAGILYYDSTVKNPNTFALLQTAPTTQLVATSVTQAVLTCAQNVSNYAAGLAATQTYGNITTSTTFTGNGGLNVVDIANINNAPLKIVGGAKDTFVFNISGAYSTNVAMTLQGVTASQILFNFTATSGTVFSTSGGDVSYGTYLAADGGDFQFSNLNLTGELINTAGNVQLVSGSGVGTFQKFTPAVPEADTYLFGVFLIGVIAVSRIRRPTAVAVE
jgi:hypothetical protein